MDSSLYLWTFHDEPPPWSDLHLGFPCPGASFVDGEELREDLYVQRGSCEVPRDEPYFFAENIGIYGGDVIYSKSMQQFWVLTHDIIPMIKVNPFMGYPHFGRCN